jgi:NADPH:quinone reductase-like Zn-dependent oxidoreductase
MRALVLERAGEGVEPVLADVPAPALSSPGDVRVAMRASALNRLDVFVAEGLPGIPASYPHIMGADGAGVVESVGADVTSVRPGDEVLFNPGTFCGECPACRRGDEALCDRISILGEHRSGTAAELVVLPARNVAPAPAGWSWAERAALTVATLTAWRMLSRRARVQPGETVLVWGAGGGVAQAAIQVAVHLGATVIATSSRAEGMDRARQLGARHVVNHKADDVVAFVKGLTGRRGCDVVVDSVGEATWPASLRLLARGGRMVVCGATSGPTVGLDARRLFWHQWSILGSTMGSRAEFREMLALAHSGKFRPVVDQVVPLAEGAQAYARLARGEQLGKLVIEVTP